MQYSKDSCRFNHFHSIFSKCLIQVTQLSVQVIVSLGFQVFPIWNISSWTIMQSRQTFEWPNPRWNLHIVFIDSDQIKIPDFDKSAEPELQSDRSLKSRQWIVKCWIQIMKKSFKEKNRVGRSQYVGTTQPEWQVLWAHWRLLLCLW